MMDILTTLGDLLVGTASAQVTPITPYCEGLHPGCGAGRFFIIQLANRVIDIISIMIGGFATVQILYGSIKIITSGGNEEGRNKGKSFIVAALIGVFLAIMGRAFVHFVGDFITTYAPPLAE